MTLSVSERCERLVDATHTLLSECRAMSSLVGIEPRGFVGLPDLLAELMLQTAGIPVAITNEAYSACPELLEYSLEDIEETTRRNFEPGGLASTVLFSRGVQAIIGHRVAHRLWQEGLTLQALAVKARCSRAFATDIHPGATIGAGFWLDHGLGFVAGETCEIGRDVSIWHNVTLGSTLADSGPRRHPRIGDGAVIGAGALILGNITVGAGANIAAGSIVTNDVPVGRLVTGARAQEKGSARITFARSVQEQT